MNNVVELKNSVPDGELLGEALLDLSAAMEKLMEMKHPDGQVLFQMVHSVMCYEEFYLRDLYNVNGGNTDWPKPIYPAYIKDEGDDPAA